jgi:hypothetical protein
VMLCSLSKPSAKFSEVKVRNFPDEDNRQDFSYFWPTVLTIHST